MLQFTRSLRGRFLATAGVLVAVLVGIAAYGDRLVHRTSAESHVLVERYYSSHKALASVEQDLGAVAAALEDLAAGPVPGNREGSVEGDARLATAIAALERTLGRILDGNDVTGQQRFQGIPEAVEENMRRLRAAAAERRPTDGARPLEAVRGLVHLVERRVYDAMVDKTFAALAASDTLSGIIWGLVVVIFLMVMAAYSHFELSIRKPLLQVAEALRAEGRGMSAEVPAPRTVETSLLIDAFNGMRNQVHSRQLRLQSVLDNTSDGILTFDDGGVIESVNRAAESLFGFTRAEVVGQHIGQVIPWPVKPAADATGGQELEMEVRRRDGTPFHLSLKLSEFTLGGRRFINALVADISARKVMIDRLTALAERDPLTGLYNRRSFHDGLDQAFARARRNPAAGFGLLSIDLDRFKYVNDTMGHQAGDLLLQEVAAVLRRRQRDGDLLGRLGGDEFAVLVAGADAAGAREAAEAFRRGLADYGFSHGGKAVEIGCSIGVALYDPDCGGPEDVLARADLAVRVAKHRGRNRVHVYTETDREARDRSRAEVGRARMIEAALQGQGIGVLYEPCVCLVGGRPFAWMCRPHLRHDDGGTVAAEVFMPAAVRFGRAIDIDRRVLDLVLADLAALDAPPAGPVAVPLSGPSLADRETVDVVRRRLAQSGVPAEALVFEVGEPDMMAGMGDARATLRALRGLGCGTALSGFGAGHSSFIHLRDLPVDHIILDGGLTGGPQDDPVRAAMVAAVARVAGALGVPTVATAVATATGAAHLAGLGVTYGAGPLFGPPRPLVAEQGDRRRHLSGTPSGASGTAQPDLFGAAPQPI